MSKIVSISCVSKKLPYKAKAKDLYVSSLFQYNLQLVRSFHPQKIFVLSAKHGLLNPNKITTPYNETLNNMSIKKPEGQSSTDFSPWVNGIKGCLKKVIPKIIAEMPGCEVQCTG